MEKGYKILGNYIRLVDERNRNLAITKLLGVSINKKFIPSIANIVGREAAREGTPITLIDGNDLIRLVIKYELYITPVTTYVLDGFYTED